MPSNHYQQQQLNILKKKKTPKPLTIIPEENERQLQFEDWFNTADYPLPLFLRITPLPSPAPTSVPRKTTPSRGRIAKHNLSPFCVCRMHLKSLFVRQLSITPNLRLHDSIPHRAVSYVQKVIIVSCLVARNLC